MVESRGKRGKASGWQVSLGVKQVFLAVVGIAGLVLVSFTLGILTGRGEMYRFLGRWGIISPEAVKAIQPWLPPQVGGPAAMPPALMAIPTQSNSSPVPQPAAASPAGAPAQTVPTAGQTPVKGLITAPPTLVVPQPSPKTKTAKTRQERQSKEKTKEEELRRMRTEVAPKLQFQNSLDSSSPKPAHQTHKAKAKGKEKEHLATARSSSSLVRVAKFRDRGRAKAKAEELKKQGEKVTLKEGKDQEGAYFILYRQLPASKSKREAATLARSPQKSRQAKQKSRGDAGQTTSD